MKQQLLRYWLAMNASALQGAAHAGKAWLATAGAHAISAAVPSLNFNQFLAVLGFAFALGILDWLDEHPLPQPGSGTGVPPVRFNQTETHGQDARATTQS